MEKRNVTRKELATAINEKLGVSLRDSAGLVDAFFSVLKDNLVEGKSIKIVHFGSFIVRNKTPRKGRNPRTGEAMIITKRQMVTFRPSKQLRSSLNV